MISLEPEYPPMPRLRASLGALLGLCALGLLLFASGCSSPTSSKSSKTACNCEKDKGGSVIKALTGQDSLVKSAKASGKGAVTGSLTGESKSDVVKGLLKIGRNAAGEQRALTGKTVPLSGATILIFDALQPTTAAETTLTTDKNGNYGAVLKPGRYFGFAVHLDLATFRLVTASIPFMNPVKDTIVAMDTAIAIEDVTGPTIASVYDATSPDAAGLFQVSPQPASGGRLNVVFSEPMQRESARGLLMGKVDGSNTSGSLVLKDTVPASALSLSWSGDSKVLTVSLGRLEAGSRYGLVLSTSFKDLAKNPLEKEYRAAFDAVSASQAADQPFTVSSMFPLEKEALKPSQIPYLVFSKPPQVFSALGSIVMQPSTQGYWEVNGSRLNFIHKDPLKVGTTYNVLVPDTVSDLSGKKLGKAFQWSFTVKDYDGAAKDKTGVDRQVALLVEDFFSAYLQADVGRMASLLGQTFRLEADGQFLSGQQFLDRIRREGADKARLAAGFSGPVFRSDAAACSTHTALWKVASDDGRDTLWVQTRTVPGILPKVYRKEVEITSGLTWSKTESRFTLNGKTYAYDLAASASGVSDNGQSDPRYFGERLRQTTAVVLEPVQDEIRDEFTIDGGISVTDLSAKVAVKLSTVTRHGRRNWDPALACAEGGSVDTSYHIVKFLLGSDGSKWLFTHAVDEGKLEKSRFAAAVVAADFKVREIKPITLSSPVNRNNGSADADGRVTFKFKGLDMDSVGGYLAGLAEDPKFIGGRASLGGLYFIKGQGKGADHGFVLGSKGEVVAGATAILRELSSLSLPGWERTTYKYPLTEMFNPTAGLAGVFQWKVIAVRDTSASQFLASGFVPDRFYGESDFGPNLGSFAYRGYPNESEFNKIDKQTTTAAATTATDFADRDLDGFPDYMEANYQTNPSDKGSYPNFTVDTDGDGLADFLEMLVNPDGIEKEASAADKKAFFIALTAKGVKWTDSDGDGFPDDVEKLLGYKPDDAASKPATRARVPAPTGVFAGLLKVGDNAYALKFKVRELESGLSVSYSAALKDTLADTVSAALNEAMGEFLFPIRLPDNGPDSGRSLLLRGLYDKNRAFLSGTVNRIASVARTSSVFGGGPFVGQYAASGRGEDVGASLGIVKAGADTAKTQTQAAAAALLSYRKPPLGVGEQAHFMVAQGAGKLLRLTLLDDFGDTLAVIDSTRSYSQEDGGFDLDGRLVRSDAAKFYSHRFEVHARLGRGKDSTGDIWVLDGSLAETLDSCRTLAAGKCTDRFFRDIPGQFSLKAPAASVKTVAGGATGNFSGWLQQDKFGTGLSADAGTTPANTGGTTGNTGTGAVGNEPPQSFAKAFVGTADKFRLSLSAAGILPGDVFYVSMLGRVMRTVNDTLHVKNAAFPYCGNVALQVTPIPLLDGAGAAEKAAFSRDSGFVSGGKYAVLAIDDDAQPGTPARLAKARDALGFVRGDVFLIEARYLDPASFVGAKCLDGNLPPLSPNDAGLPALPSGAAYFRGDLEALRAGLSGAGNQITVVSSSGSAVSAAPVNPATLRLDPDTKAALVANADDPSLNYVLLAESGKPGTPRLVNGRPSALVR